jgi:hypothetical protein
MNTLSEPDTKMASKTGLSATAIIAYELLRHFSPRVADMVPPGVVETLLSFAVIMFRRFSDGKKPTVV